MSLTIVSGGVMIMSYLASLRLSFVHIVYKQNKYTRERADDPFATLEIPRYFIMHMLGK